MAEITTLTTAHEQVVLAEVLKALRTVRYGYVQITLQDSRVVQIDTLEKKRLDR
ncbi:MAG: YezD family protein [Dehalococcoidia bacterium]